jgi:glutathionylspermidine synthase
MRRIQISPRPNWQKTVESQGMYYHSLPNYQPAHPLQEPALAGSRTYWDESVYYQFDQREIDEIERCTNRLNECCLQAVQHVIDQDLFASAGIPAPFIDWVKRSWERDEHTIYGRFDLSYSGQGPPKLLEYNADTPTGLLEAAVIQWFWLKDARTGDDQFNSLHERLIEIFKTLRTVHEGRFYFAALAGNLEDFITVNYLRDCAMQAGWDTEYINMEDIGWHQARGQFTNLQERPISLCFKLYPWEWMTRERFGQNLLLDTCAWFEPPWKMVLSNKGILVILRELFPDSPYLLDASFEPLPAGEFFCKPIHGREGNNIQMVSRGEVILETAGPYDGPCIYQELWPLPNFDGNYPVLGSWLVNGYACGLGIREDMSPITQNTSRFVPHVISASADQHFA